MLSHIYRLLSRTYPILAYILLVCAAGSIWWTYTEIGPMLGNYGPVHTYLDIALSGIMVLAFPLFLVGTVVRAYTYGKKETDTKKTFLGTVGGLVGTVLSGCSCCSLTLAAPLGLLPLLQYLPYSGLEIKIIGTLGLLYAVYDLFKNYDTCRYKIVDRN